MKILTLNPVDIFTKLANTSPSKGCTENIEFPSTSSHLLSDQYLKKKVYSFLIRTKYEAIYNFCCVCLCVLFFIFSI